MNERFVVTICDDDSQINLCIESKIAQIKCKLYQILQSLKITDTSWLHKNIAFQHDCQLSAILKSILIWELCAVLMILRRRWSYWIEIKQCDNNRRNYDYETQLMQSNKIHINSHETETMRTIPRENWTFCIRIRRQKIFIFFIAIISRKVEGQLYKNWMFLQKKGI
jgi:hypothetical protein